MLNLLSFASDWSGSGHVFCKEELVEDLWGNFYSLIKETGGKTIYLLSLASSKCLCLRGVSQRDYNHLTISEEGIADSLRRQGRICLLDDIIESPNQPQDWLLVKQATDILTILGCLFLGVENTSNKW